MKKFGLAARPFKGILIDLEQVAMQIEKDLRKQGRIKLSEYVDYQLDGWQLRMYVYPKKETVQPDKRK